MCIPHNIYGFKRVTHGAMADYMIYTAGSKVHKIPKGMDPFEAAFVEPFACSLHAVELGQIKVRSAALEREKGN
jgi:threonine dehydrogenase-like Zn-dependent dehydrogenase